MARRIEHQNNPTKRWNKRVAAIGGSIAAIAHGSPIIVDANHSVIVGAVRVHAARILDVDTLSVIELCRTKPYAD